MSAKHPNGLNPHKFTAKQVEGWRKLQRDNKWSKQELASHLGLSFTTVRKGLEKHMYGELT